MGVGALEPSLDRVGVECHERSCQPLEVLRVGCGCDIEIHGCSPMSMDLRGNPADHQIVHVVFSEHPKHLPEVQRALRNVAHDRT